MNKPLKIALGLGALAGLLLISRPAQANQVTGGQTGGSSGGLFAFGGGSDYAGANADKQGDIYNVMVESPKIDTSFMGQTMEEPTKKETTTRSNGGSPTGYVLDFNAKMSTNREVDLFTPTSASSSDRFASYGDSGDIADRHKQQSVSFDEAEKRASTPNFRDYLNSRTKKETASITPAGI